MKARMFGTVLGAGLALSFAAVFAQKSPAPATDEGAIFKTLDAYTTAYNKTDLAAVMTFWADGAEIVDESGAVTRGKEAVTARFKQALVEHKGRTLSVKVKTLRLLRPDLALLDGTVDVKSPDGDSDAEPFASVWTKTAGRWQILSVRDLPGDAGATANASAEQLRQLDWLVGEWVFQDKETAVTLSCRRTQKQSFLLIEQTVKVKGEEVLSLTQVIGWDPLQQQLRSWVFDSAAGFGGGLWERQGNAWVVTAEGVRSDGREASGTNSWRYINPDTFEWAASDREIDGEPAPDMKVRYTRRTGKQ